jgi:hypothetical protein
LRPVDGLLYFSVDHFDVAISERIMEYQLVGWYIDLHVGLDERFINVHKVSF